jgi:hypothetical protein
MHSATARPKADDVRRQLFGLLELGPEEVGATPGMLPFVGLTRPIGAGSIDDGVTDLTAE